MRASRSTATSSSGPRTRRSRSAFSSATWPASRSPSSARPPLVTWLSRGRLRPTAGWGAVAGAGASAGVGFTVSLLVATLAFDGAQLEGAKAGILAAPVGAAAVTWLVFRTIGLLSQRRRIAALLCGAEPLLDLEFAVDPER